MQMLESFLGTQGALFVQFGLAAVVLIILVLVLWWLIRKAMGGRLNMSDKPDRRGRPPRLGITESFTVDREGRRLVMVRRDNVEHLVMIGGPNDVLIESNVIRGERPMVGRPEVRISEADLLAQPVLAEVSASTPVLAPVPAQIKQAPPPRPTEINAPKPLTVPAPAPVPVAPPSAPVLKSAPQPPAPQPVIDLPKPVLVEPAPAATIPETPALDIPATPRSSGLTLAERIKAGLPLGATSPRPAELARMPESPRTSEPPKAEAPKPVPVPEAPKPPAMPELKARVEETIKVPLETAKAEIVEAIKLKAEPVVSAPTLPVPPMPSPAPAPATTVAPAPPAPPSPTASTAPKMASRNPFDSLEEEMAKLLGRAPDGKG
jgi:flagellar protein FliO/FliZ